MGQGPKRRKNAWRGRRGARPGLGLALIALLVTVLVPPGYMTVAGQGGPSLVICSGHGPVTITGDGPGQPAKAPKSKPDAPCVFAGHGVAVGPAPVAPLSGAVFIATAEPARALVDLTPGRGLAAPPPPAQAPPAASAP